MRDGCQKSVLLQVRFLQLACPLAQLALQSSLRGHVADGAGYKAFARGRQRAERYIDRKFAAVLSQAEQLKAAAHGPRVGLDRKLLALSDMRAAGALWHEHFNEATDQFLPAVTKHLLGLAVDLGDCPISIDDHNRIWGRFKEAREKPVWLNCGNLRPPDWFIKAANHANRLRVGQLDTLYLRCTSMVHVTPRCRCTKADIGQVDSRSSRGQRWDRCASTFWSASGAS